MFDMLYCVDECGIVELIEDCGVVGCEFCWI